MVYLGRISPRGVGCLYVCTMKCGVVGMGEQQAPVTVKGYGNGRRGSGEVRWMI